MHAQRHTAHAPRPHHGRHAFPRTPTRARVGLLMRRSQNFGPLIDAEPALRSGGLALAPIAVDDAGLSTGGVTILPTARTADIDNGALKALVVPGGGVDSAEAAEGVRDAIGRALAKGAPILAFGEGVATALRAAGRDPAEFAESPAVLIHGDGVRPLDSLDAVSEAARGIG